MENLEIWNQLNQPPKWALKQIKGGRLKGMTDVNPQWRYHILTEVFGPCGIGWKFSIDELWIEPGNGNEIFAFAQVSLFISGIADDGRWSDPIPGIGGSKLVQQESSGPHNNDEAYKMAVTDALSTAFKMLGVASDIYMGLWDGSKYIEKDKVQDEPQKGRQGPHAKRERQKEVMPPTIKQSHAIKKMSESKGLIEDDYTAFYKFVLSNSENGESVAWASDFIKNFEGYYNSFVESKF